MADVSDGIIDIEVAIWVYYMEKPCSADLYYSCLISAALAADRDQLNDLGKAYPNLVEAAKIHRGLP